MSHPLDKAMTEVVHEVEGIRFIGYGSPEEPYTLDPEDMAALHGGGPCHCRQDDEQ